MSQPLDRKAKAQSAAPTSHNGPSKALVGAIVALLALVAVIAGAIPANEDKKETETAGGSTLPTGVAAEGDPIVVGAKSGAPVLDIYEDPQCPACASLESAVGEDIAAMIDKKQITARYHVMTFLDENLDGMAQNKQSSNRAANGMACAQDQGKFVAYHDAIYRNHPAEGAGWSDDELRAKAEEAGITGAGLEKWQKCYDNREHNQYVTSVDKAATKDGVNATPTLKLNGEVIDFQKAGIKDSASFRKYVLAAK